MLKKKIEDIMKRKNRKNDTLERDIQVVQTYYGLGTQAYPTYEAIGKELHVGTRENVRQIITRKFVNRVNKEECNLLNLLSNYIESQDIWFVDDLIGKLSHQGLIEKDIHIKGLIQLLQVFDYCKEYQLFNVNIEKATQENIVQKVKLLLMKKSIQPQLAAQVKTLKTLPNQHGMVNFSEVVKKNNWLDKENKDFFQCIIRHTKNSKIYHDTNNHMWFLFEESDNVMINALRKIVNITTQVNKHILAEAIYSDIKKRSFEKSIPSIDLIKQYIEDSRYIEVEEDIASLTLDKKELNEIEIDIVNFLKKQPNCTSNSSQLNAYLKDKGYSKSYRIKKLFNCPLVYIDRSKGRGNYPFTLIDQFSAQRENDYEKYKKKLAELQGKTDVARETKQRTEQVLLRDWLFKGKETEHCAICGRKFSIHSLVAAHKKKRAHCTEIERTDPHIVMPVCKFGCDHLYEEDFISIEDGKIALYHLDTLQKAEREYLQKLNNRKIDERWLQGKKSYFTTNGVDDFSIASG